MGTSDDETSPTELRPDRYYPGWIRRLQRSSQSGLVESATGREIPFVFPHVGMVGEIRKFDQLREGMSVGFDVGWTSRGLRVTVLKVDPLSPEGSPR